MINRINLYKEQGHIYKVTVVKLGVFQPLEHPVSYALAFKCYYPYMHMLSDTSDVVGQAIN